MNLRWLNFFPRISDGGDRAGEGNAGGACEERNRDRRLLTDLIQPCSRTEKRQLALDEC